MAINEWWAGDQSERYWLEVTDRESLGSNIIAPKYAAGGRETPSYTLVSHVRPGDVVFHWWKRLGEDPAIVGFSKVVGDAFDSELVWQAHGSYGRARSGPSIGDAWEAPLSGFEELESPVTLGELRSVEPALKAIRDRLRGAIKDGVYFPFAFSDKRPLRTAQGYLFKLPAAVVELLPSLREELQDVLTPASREDPRRGTGTTPRQADPAVRRAIETHAVEWTLAHLTHLGYLVDNVGATESFDVFAIGADLDELHVEVKGSSTFATVVNLTDGEVKHWGSEYRRLLVVVDQIQWRRETDGQITTLGGRPRVWWDWEIDPDALEPTQYRYTLEAGWSIPS